MRVDERVPRQIFTMWRGPPPPEIVTLCIERMRALHPGWRVTALNGTDEEPCEGLERLSMQHQSDWARICAIERHGGVWLDATCICTQPVDRWVDMTSSQLQGFSAPFAADVLENWAFAAPAGNAFVRAWKEEFSRAIRMGFDAYKASLPPHVRDHALYGQLPYLTMHACYLVVSHLRDKGAAMTPSCDGPFRYLCETGFDTRRSVHLLATRPLVDAPPLIKLRGPERMAVNRCSRGSFLHRMGLRTAERERWVFRVCGVVVVVALALGVAWSVLRARSDARR